jgi:protein-tyrosine phosphatase
VTQHEVSPCRLLFLCTGNYYRSRFAEVLFNRYADRAGLNWEATSRGIATELGVHNVGPISTHTLEALAARGIVLPEPIGHPEQVQEQDLSGADLIVALKEAEHRPLLQQRYPQWPDRVQYWHVDDLDRAAPEEALASIEQEIQKLVQRLSQNGHGCEQAGR